MSELSKNWENFRPTKAMWFWSCAGTAVVTMVVGFTWGGWVKTLRFIEIEEIDAGSCIVANGELFEGFVARRYGRRHRWAMKTGYAAMLEALKIHAERLWRDDPSGAR